MPRSKTLIFGVAITLTAAVGCSSGSTTSDAGVDANSGGSQIFATAIDDIRGTGSLLGVWVGSEIAVTTGQVDKRAYIVGGFVGVPSTALPDGTPAGQVLGWDGAEHFDTLCRADHPLRAVYSQQGNVYAGGDQSSVVRYDTRTHECVEQSFPVTDGSSVSIVSIAGMNTDGPDLFAVGSITNAAGTRQGAMFRFDGSAWSAVTLPSAMGSSALAGIAYQTRVGFWVVAEDGATMRRAMGGTEWTVEQIPLDSSAGPVRSVSIEGAPTPSSRDWSMIAGGSAAPLILARNVSDLSWALRPTTAMPTAPIYATRVESECEAYFVGKGGMNAVFNSQNYFVPMGAPLTRHDLYGVHSSSGRVLAVGGDTSDASARQPGVILIRDGEVHGSFSVNGTAYTPAQVASANDFGGCGPQ